MSIKSTLHQQLHHHRRFMTDEVYAYLSSPEAAAAAAAAEHDPRASAIVMIETLKGVALDPLRGNKAEHFMIDHGDCSTFWLQFDRLGHFITMFDLSKSDPAHAELVEAMRENIASRMFKAAAMARRTHAVLGRLESRNVRKWHQIHDAYVAERLQPDAYGAKRDAVYQQAIVEAQAATLARDDQLRRRGRLISEAAAPSLAGKGWYEWVIDRLVASLPALTPATA